MLLFFDFLSILAETRSRMLKIREDKKVALVMAGLPFQVFELIADKRISFLRRALQRHLGRISDVGIEQAFRSSVEDAGKTIGEEALALATNASDGFPFMMQLVGYRFWMSEYYAPLIPLVSRFPFQRRRRLGIMRIAAAYRMIPADASPRI